jgi:hypothetical protein
MQWKLDCNKSVGVWMVGVGAVDINLAVLRFPSLVQTKPKKRGFWCLL